MIHSTTSPTAMRTPVRRPAVFLFAALASVTLSGCSLFVMAGRMLTGDPLVKCAFSQATGVDLTDGDKSIIIICDAPASAKEKSPSIDFDIMDGTMRQLKGRGVKMVDPNKVASWLDDNGGIAGNVTAIAQQFDVDYIIRIDLDSIAFTQENSPELFQGTALGTVYAYEVQKTPDGGQRFEEVLSREYTSTYPGSHPIDSTRVSAKVFEKRYVDRVCTELAQMFYDYNMGDLIN